jgi:GNAT superfamily N-acetyltransferase
MRSLRVSGKASRSRSNLSKANPYRDGSSGRFTTGGTGAVASSGNVTNVQIQTYPPDENGEISSRVTGEFKTKNGDTVKLIHDNTKLADGTIEMETVANLVVPGGAKKIGYMDSSRDPRSYAQYGATIESIQVDAEYRRQGIASAMLGFARTYSQDGVKIDHSFSLTDDAKAWSSVFKANPYRDGSTGRFTTGGAGGKGVGYNASDKHPRAQDSEGMSEDVEYYTSSGYSDINNYLRTGAKPELGSVNETKGYIESLDTEISKTSAPRDMVLFRGTTGVEKFEKLEVGDTFTDKGFVSTTTNRETVTEFMSTATGGRFDSRPVEKGVVLQISVPQGEKVLSVKNYFKGVSDRYGPSEGILSETEHILPRGTTFRVDSIGKINVRDFTEDTLIKVSVIKK